ncbi:SDR family oxidoreductase [Pseudomonas sp. SZMC_28357]|uniref:SDR family NAD(P)-dependent oxidoreductase n=1 Tax=Pseudomonas sp. SZMC_28357 TaxID=3074380 RepID=UPI00287276D3|nr:SDR family oxidoreductase [Pseudomonas sp. SZMC_28357]MDR9754175.1 SDR family oxidoreductase [Pseudomonas sp. SZMC_28357]
MNDKFANKVAVVTGGSTGIGFSIAEALITQGAKRVYITGRSETSLTRAVTALGSAAIAVVSDVVNLRDIQQLRELIENNDDQLDVVFANAGICEKRVFGETTEQDFDRTFDINVKGVFFTVQTLLPLIKDGASVILTSSICSSNGMLELGAYNASKAAVRSFARTWANELRGRKIRVNALSPGFTRTPLMENSLKLNQQQIDELADWAAQTVPLGYMAQPEEIASAALFLASDDAKYVNGIELTVDGGISQI